MTASYEPKESLRRYILGYRLGVADGAGESEPDWDDLCFMRGYNDGQKAFNFAVFDACEHYGVPPRTFGEIETASVDQTLASLESLRQMAAKRAEEGVMTLEEVTPAPARVPELYRRALDITVVCEVTRQRLEGAVLPTGNVRWTCSCGHVHEVDPQTLAECPDDLVFIEAQDCRAPAQCFQASSSALKEFQQDPRTGANIRVGPGVQKEDISPDDDQEGG